MSKLVIDSSGVSVVSDDGTERELSFFDEPQDAIDALAAALEAEPVAEYVSGQEEPGPFTSYSWDAISLSVADDSGSTSYISTFSVYVDAAESNGVPIETTDGIQVGDAAADVAELFADGVSTYVNDAGGTGFMVDTNIVDAPKGAPADATYAVGLQAADETGSLTSIFAPSANFLS